MLPGPIFRVELVSAARRRRYFLLRVLYATVILFVLWITYESAVQWRQFSANQGNPSIQQVATAAATFFVSFSWVQLIGLLAVAPAMAVGTIATERERRTIEYLFATDLSNAEIVLGKTLARLALIGKFVLVGLPILFIFRLFGGIPARMLAASFIISGSTAVFLTALSICISVWSRRSRDATVRVYLALVVILLLPLVFTLFGFVLGGGALWQQLMGHAVTQLSRVNPIWTLGEAISGVNAVGANLDFGPIMEMVGWHAALSVGLIGLATAAVRRVHLRESTRGSTSKKQIHPQVRSTLPTMLGPRRRVGNRPMIWKELFAGTSKTVLGVVGVLAVAVIALTMVGFTLYAFYYSLSRNSAEYAGFLIFFSGFAGPAAMILVAARASGLVTLEKERDAWLSLLATPLTGAEIIAGKALGNLYAAKWALALLAFSWVLALFFDVAFVLTFALLTTTFVVCAAFVTMLGLFYSLRSQTSMRAMGLTLATAIFIGGGYMFCCCPVLAIGGGLNGSDEGIMVGLAPCIPFLMAFPALAYNAMRGTTMAPSGDEFHSFLAAYCVGMFGYIVATGVLYANMIIEFDALVGRTRERPESSPPQFGRRPDHAVEPAPRPPSA